MTSYYTLMMSRVQNLRQRGNLNFSTTEMEMTSVEPQFHRALVEDTVSAKSFKSM